MPLLELDAIESFYGDFQALFGITVEVAEGEKLAIIGANGAGKSTLLATAAGLLQPERGEVRFDGQPLRKLPAHERVPLGIALVPEGRHIFPSLTVEENLLIGAHCGRPGPWTLPRVYELFPILAERRTYPATSLSGGQQQMAAIGRALMSNPRLLLCDELSLGLAPVVIRDIYACLGAIARNGTTLVIVEQDIQRALDASARFYCFQEGRVALTAPSRGFDRRAITTAYFGL